MGWYIVDIDDVDYDVLVYAADALGMTFDEYVKTVVHTWAEKTRPLEEMV